MLQPAALRVATASETLAGYTQTAAAVIPAKAKATVLFFIQRKFLCIHFSMNTALSSPPTPVFSQGFKQHTRDVCYAAQMVQVILVLFPPSHPFT